MYQKALREVLAYDLGGTKVAVGVVDETGRVLAAEEVPVLIEKGKKAVLNQLCQLGKKFVKKFNKVEKIGIASAGPLHAPSGTLLDPTNFTSKKGSWGRVPLAKIIEKELGLPTFLENDAAAAILAEHWVGEAKKVNNAIILTLGTGLGTGIIVNGKLVTAGRGLHPEAGHIIINFQEPEILCGCGNYGCSEAYLSGKGFARWASRCLKENLSGKDLAALARKEKGRGKGETKDLFEIYGEILAVAIHNFVTIYAPEVVILAGSFSAAADLFLPATRNSLKVLLGRRCQALSLMPKIVVSKLKNQSGLIGGAYVAFHSSKT